jgi:gamma-glutamylputrescine oxidase
MSTTSPQDQVFWYLNRKQTPQLRHNITADVVIVGGGMAGMSAAQSFHAKGLSVVLLEKTYCGAGASGKSSGFVTPESELNLAHFTRLVGPDGAGQLWNFGVAGGAFIEDNIRTHNIACDYQVQDTLVVASTEKAFTGLQQEYTTREKHSFASQLVPQHELGNILGSQKYFGGLRSFNTFSISSYRYLQAMKEILLAQGVQIFEETPVTKVHAKGADTELATVEAKHVVVCVDRFIPDLHILEKDIYQAQTFILLSAPLSDAQVKKIFPEKPLMVWDTELIYNYYRMVEGNRFLIGGSDIFASFWGKEQHNLGRISKKLTAYAQEKFPQVELQFEYFWPGLIGVSKDSMPIAGRDPISPNIYYMSGAAGLPWAAALGHYSADNLINNKTNLDTYFSPDRKFPLGQVAQAFLGKRITFALSNFISGYK